MATSETEISGSPPHSLSTSCLQVDVDLWQYMNKHSKYSGSVEKVMNDCHVSAKMESSGRLELTADSKEDVHKAQEGIESMIEHCQQSVRVQELPQQTPEIYERVLLGLDQLHLGTAVVSAANGNIRIIGNNDEVASTLNKLKDSFGVVDDSSECQEEPQRDASPSMDDEPKESNTAQCDDAASANKIESQQISLEYDLWKYMQKNSSFATTVKRLKEDMFVDMVESVSEERGKNSEQIVYLLFSGPVDDVTTAVRTTAELVAMCRENCRLFHVECTNNVVFSKISKFLPMLNKSGGYVSTGDQMVTVTGSDSEITECRSKLEKLGLEWKEKQVKVPGVASPPAPAVVDTSDFNIAAIPDDRPAPPLFPDMNDRWQPTSAEDVMPGSSAPIGDCRSDGRSTIIELPVPIESSLWSFIEKRRRSQLQELRDIYAVSVRSSPAEEGFVIIQLEASSMDMLECGQDALINLLEQLRQSVIVTAMELGEGGRELPQELHDLFEQLAQDTDAIVEIAGSRIVIVGSSQGASVCQQKIVAFMQQMSAQSGHAPMGRGQGGNMDMGSMGRGMQNQMMMPSGPRGTAGGRSGMLGGPGRMPGMGNMMGGHGMPGPRGPAQGMMGGHGMPGPRGPAQGMMSAGFGGMIGGPRGQIDTMTNGRAGMDGSMGGPRGPPPVGSQSHMGSDDVEDKFDDMGEFGGTMGGAQYPASGKFPNTEMPPSSAMLSASTADRSRKKPEQQSDVPQMLEEEDELTNLGYGDLETRQPGGIWAKEMAAAASYDDGSRQNADRVLDQSTAASNARKPATDAVEVVQHCSDDACTACQAAGGHQGQRPEKKCPHAFCVSCIQSYFSQGESECPVCGVKNEVVGRMLTQPSNGHMLTTFDNSYKLPGFETSSRGTIVVIYSFPPGVQSDDMLSPGRRYAGTTKSAFFPMSTDGMKLVNLVQCAFDARVLFTLKPSRNGADDELVWNGICHKTNVFGGPQQNGYPDPVYIRRVQNELAAKGIH